MEFSVDTILRDISMSNQKKLAEIKSNFIHLSALSIPSLAIIFQTISVLPSVESNCPLVAASIGIGFHFIATGLTLIFLVFVPLFKKFIPLFEKFKSSKINEDYYDYRTQHENKDYYDYRTQHECKDDEAFIYLICGYLTGKDLDVTERDMQLEKDLAKHILRTGGRIYRLELAIKIIISLYALAVLSYAVAALIYAFSS